MWKLHAKAMINMRGVGRKSHLTGSSVYNQHIERSWRDTFRCVGQLYYAIFYEMEDINLLNVDNDIDLFCLQFVFLPRINAQLDQFASAWNNHPLRTENGLSPLQLWTRGVLSAAPTFQAEILDGMTVNDDYGEEGNHHGISSISECEADGVTVREININLSQQKQEYIQNFNPLLRSDPMCTYKLKIILKIPKTCYLNFFHYFYILIRKKMVVNVNPEYMIMQ